jgi:hypothetical protein
MFVWHHYNKILWSPKITKPFITLSIKHFLLGSRYCCIEADCWSALQIRYSAAISVKIGSLLSSIIDYLFVSQLGEPFPRPRTKHARVVFPVIQSFWDKIFIPIKRKPLLKGDVAILSSTILGQQVTLTNLLLSNAHLLLWFPITVEAHGTLVVGIVECLNYLFQSVKTQVISPTLKLM